MHTQPTLYIVTFDMIGGFTGNRMTGSYELDMDRMTRSQIADDILTGMFDDVAKVYEAIPGEPLSDITEDIASIVRDRIVNEQLPRGQHVDWLHSTLGCESIRWPIAAE